MQNKDDKQPVTLGTRFILFVLLPALFCIFCVLCGAYLISMARSQNSTPSNRSLAALQVSPTQTQATIISTNVANSTNNDVVVGPQQGKPTPTTTIPTATPTQSSISSQHGQLGVFPLSAGGPLPVPGSVLKPTNIARVMLSNTLISVYAGSMATQPQVGILCILRDDLVTGAVHIQMYQGSQTDGALTILSVHNNVLKVADSVRQGTFDLNTNSFQWK